MSDAQLVLVTGSTGFIGQRLCAVLLRDGLAVRTALHRPVADAGRIDIRGQMESAVVGNIDAATDWSRAVDGVGAVVHLAGRVHVMHEHAVDPLNAYRRTNTDGTVHLARAAVQAGVRRFVFVSTIKVNGETTSEKAFDEHDTPAPSDAYALSKWEAEQGLWEIAHETGLEVVIVRPPLVYGPGVKGNFFSLLRLVQRGLPLPFNACTNRRSLVGLDNMAGFLMQCLSDPHAAGNTFLVSDGEDLSTSELIRRLARAMDRPARLFSIPSSWLRAAGSAIGRPGLYERLCASLQVDIGKANRVLDWSPQVSVDEELARTAEWFLRAGATC
jgi:nucleoside-diphosphate-sugar epimerase